MKKVPERKHLSKSFDGRFSQVSFRKALHFSAVDKLATKMRDSLQPSGWPLPSGPSKEFLEQVFHSLTAVRDFPLLSPALLRQKRLVLPKRVGYELKKTLVLDLNETLVHCVEPLDGVPSTVLSVPLPDGTLVRAGINLRPYLRECLVRASQHFEVIVFTSSHRCYADAVLDYLDPGRELVHHRLYRDHCILAHGYYIKDLRMLAGRRLQDMVIVDNSVHCFGYQLDNGVPIVSWYDDPHDQELKHLADYLEILKDLPDTREANRRNFKLDRFYKDYLLSCA